MAEALKVLAQTAPAYGTLTDGYTVPAITSAVVSSIVICNQSVTATTFRVSVAVVGAADAVKQYLFYDETLLGNDTFTAVLGITLGAADVIRVYSGNGSVSFSFFGAEET